MDAARSARRPGADVTIGYRPTEKELPARAEEVEHAKEEGIVFQFLTNPLHIDGNDEGWVRSITCQQMKLSEPDESGRARPVPIEGREFDIETDCVIMALCSGFDERIGRSANCHDDAVGFYVKFTAFYRYLSLIHIFRVEGEKICT